jgi:hypothetical protein
MQGHLAFGCSIWKTEILHKLYDYHEVLTPLCECVYIWRRVLRNGYRIETLNYRAIHNKKGDN